MTLRALVVLGILMMVHGCNQKPFATTASTLYNKLQHISAYHVLAGPWQLFSRAIQSTNY